MLTREIRNNLSCLINLDAGFLCLLSLFYRPSGYGVLGELCALCAFRYDLLERWPCLVADKIRHATLDGVLRRRISLGKSTQERRIYVIPQRFTFLDGRLQLRERVVSVEHFSVELFPLLLAP